jgi:hypothetical protein
MKAMPHRTTTFDAHRREFQIELRRIGARTFSAHRQQMNSPESIGWPAGRIRRLLDRTWVATSIVILLSFIPGVELELGKLPGDISAGFAGGSLRVPLMTIALLAVSLAGAYNCISRLLPDR